MDTVSKAITPQMMADYFRTSYDRNFETDKYSGKDDDGKSQFKRVLVTKNGQIDDGIEGENFIGSGWGKLLAEFSKQPAYDDTRSLLVLTKSYSIDIEDFAEWVVNKYDLNHNGRIDLSEQLDPATSNLPYINDKKTAELKKYLPYLEKIKMFDVADTDGDGILEKDDGEFGALLREYEKKYPSDNAREKNKQPWLKSWERWSQIVWDPSYVGKNALEQFEKDTNIFFQTKPANRINWTKSELIDSYEIDDAGFEIYINGQKKLTWTVEELFGIQ